MRQAYAPWLPQLLLYSWTESHLIVSYSVKEIQDSSLSDDLTAAALIWHSRQTHHRRWTQTLLLNLAVWENLKKSRQLQNTKKRQIWFILWWRICQTPWQCHNLRSSFYVPNVGKTNLPSYHLHHRNDFIVNFFLLQFILSISEIFSSRWLRQACIDFDLQWLGTWICVRNSR